MAQTTSANVSTNPTSLTSPIHLRSVSSGRKTSVRERIKTAVSLNNGEDGVAAEGLDDKCECVDKPHKPEPHKPAPPQKCEQWQKDKCAKGGKDCSE